MAKPDSLLNRMALLDLFDKEMRREIIYPDMRKDVLPWGVRFVRPSPGMSFIQYYSLDKSTADAAIQEQIDYFKEADQPFSWTVYDHDLPGDMKERLLAYGFEPDEPGAVMILGMNETPAELLATVKADIRQITQREQLGDVISVLERVWGGNFGWIWDRMGSHLEIPGYLSIYAAYVEDQPTSVGWIYYPPKSQFAGLFGGSTITEQRGHGFYKAILSKRIQDALVRGKHYLVIEAGPMSQPIVARHGFHQLSLAQDFKAPADQ